MRALGGPFFFSDVDTDRIGVRCIGVEHAAIHHSIEQLPALVELAPDDSFAGLRVDRFDSFEDAGGNVKPSFFDTATIGKEDGAAVVALILIGDFLARRIGHVVRELAMEHKGAVGPEELPASQRSCEEISTLHMARFQRQFALEETAFRHPAPERTPASVLSSNNHDAFSRRQAFGTRTAPADVFNRLIDPLEVVLGNAAVSGRLAFVDGRSR